MWNILNWLMMSAPDGPAGPCCCNEPVYYYKPTKSSQVPLRLCIKELAAARVRYGYRRIYILLRREGWEINHKRVYRLYCEEGLHLRLKRLKRRISAAHRANRPEATRVNESWSMDFVSDNLFDGRRIRSLTVGHL